MVMIPVHQEIKNTKKFEKWGDCIAISEGAEIREEKFVFINALEELIEEKIPDTLKEEVRETLLYALQFKELAFNEFVQFLFSKKKLKLCRGDR